TPLATGPHHVMMLYPFPQIIVAYAACLLLLRKVPNHFLALPIVARSVAGGLLLTLLFSNIVVDAQYLQSFRASGGRGIWSDAIYELTDYGKQNNANKLVLMDWGFETQLKLLSRGSIQREEFTAARGREEEFADELYRKVRREGSNIFVFHAPKYTRFTTPRRVFDRVLETHAELRSELVKVFYLRDGEPVYLLERVVTADTVVMPGTTLDFH